MIWMVVLRMILSSYEFFSSNLLWGYRFTFLFYIFVLFESTTLHYLTWHGIIRMSKIYRPRDPKLATQPSVQPNFCLPSSASASPPLWIIMRSMHTSYGVTAWSLHRQKSSCKVSAIARDRIAQQICYTSNHTLNDPKTL